MTWAHVIPTVVSTVVMLFVPGYLLARVLGFARLQAAGGAPALTMAAIGTLSVVYHLVGLPWSDHTANQGIVALLVVCVLGALAASFLSARARGVIGRRATPAWLAREMVQRVWAAPRPWWPILAVLALTAVWVGHAVIHGIGTADTPMQASDGVWHLNALAYVRDQDDAFPIGALAPMYWGEVHFYPTGWHAMAALVNAQPSVATNVLTLVGLALVWPVGCAGLLSALYTAPDRSLLGGLPLLVTIALSGGAIGPVVLDSMIWPYAWATILLPGALGLVMAARPRRRPGRRAARSHAGGWAGALLACLGLVSVHGASAFNLALTAVPALVLVVLLSMVRAWQAGGWRRVRVVIVWLMAAAVLVAGARAFKDQLSMLIRFKRGGADPWVVMGEIVRDDAMIAQVRIWSSGWTVLFALAVVGALVAVVRGRYRWAPLVAVAVSFLMVTSVMPGTPFQGLSSPWYVQRARLAPVLELALLVLVMATLEAARDWAVAAWRRRPGVGPEPCLPGVLARPLPGRVDIDLARVWRHWQWWRVPVAVVTVAVVTVGALSPLPARPHAVEKVVKAAYQPGRSPWKVMLSGGEARFIREIARGLPKNSVILGVPTNGSAYFWSLTGRDVVYPTLRRYSEPDRLYVAAHAKDLMTDPQVCAALGRLGADYLYVDTDTTGGGAPGGGESPRFATTIDQIPYQALQVVAHKETWTLYRISYCAMDDAEAATAGRQAAELVADPIPVSQATPSAVPYATSLPGPDQSAQPGAEQSPSADAAGQ